MIRVLLVYDAEGWCWAHQAADIKRYAPAKYEVDAVLSSVVTEDLMSHYDHVLWYSWSESPKFRHKLWTVLAHHGAMFDVDSDSYLAKAATSRNRNLARAKKLLPEFKGIIAVNPQLHKFALTLNTNTRYLPAGVNLDIFQPQWRSTNNRKLIVGWCGQRADYENTKGVKAVLEPLMSRLGDKVDFSINDRTHQIALSRDEMCEWYNSIDVFLCTSSTEGTPMPPLEAMACGKPVITTDVGDMPLLLATEGGTLCGTYCNYRTDDVISRLEKAILSYADNRDACLIAGQKARDIVTRSRDWSVLAGQWLRTISSDV